MNENEVDIVFTTGSAIPLGGSIIFYFTNAEDVDLGKSYCLLNGNSYTYTWNADVLEMDNIDPVATAGTQTLTTKMRFGATDGRVDIYIKSYYINSNVAQYLIDE